MASLGGLELDEARMGDFPLHSDSQGLEVIPAEYSTGAAASAPQTLPGPEKEAIAGNDEGEEKQFDDFSYPSKTPEQSNRFRRRRRFWLVIAFAIILIIAIVIAIVVPLVTKHKHKKTPHTSLPSSGAFDGTRFASFNHENNTFTTTHLFYQDSATQIRRLQKQGQDPNFTWSGGKNSQPISLPSPARNATPLFCVNYTDTKTNTNTAHLFYLNQTDFIQEVISKDNLATWQPGPLGDAGFEASSASIAIAAAYSDQWYGTVRGESAGLRLYYGGPGNNVQELAYALDVVTTWSLQSTLKDTNGNAGIALMPISADAFNHLFVLNSTNKQIQAWSGFFNGSKAETSFQGYGYWDSKTPTYTYDLATNSSLAYSLSHVTFQGSDNVIRTVEVYPPGGALWDAAPDTVAANGTNLQAQPGTAIGAADVFLGSTTSDKNVLDTFVQLNGSTVMECLDEQANFNCQPVPFV